MKKFFISMCMALVGLCASAQEQGDMAVGLNLGVTPSLESGMSVTNFGLGAKFQYNITTPIRLEAGLNYGFKNKGIDVFDISANVHYIFKLSDKLNIYPLAGIGYAHIGGGVDVDDLNDFLGGIDWMYEDEDADYEISGSSSASKFLVNVGAGAEYAINEKLSIGAEIKYQYIKDFSRLPISVGVTYKF